MPALQKITPFLWYSTQAEEAAKLYVSIFPDSKINRVVTMPSESPSGPADSVKVVDFELFGQGFTAMTAGTQERFNHTVSFLVSCETQQEIDRYWDALLADGGKTEACGWLLDRFGVAWQITPAKLVGMIGDADRTKARRTAEAMMKMIKLDIATLQAAYDGTAT